MKPKAMRGVAIHNTWVDEKGKEHEQVYHFHFYVGDFDRYVALCTTVGFENVFGEGSTWWSAINNCMDRYLRQEIEKKNK